MFLSARFISGREESYSLSKTCGYNLPSKLSSNLQHKAVSIPADLAFIQNDVAWKWNGEDLKAGEKLEVTLETDKDGYAIYYGSISDDGREVTFSNVPKGDYVLRLPLTHAGFG